MVRIKNKPLKNIGEIPNKTKYVSFYDSSESPLIYTQENYEIFINNEKNQTDNNHIWFIPKLIPPENESEFKLNAKEWCKIFRTNAQFPPDHIKWWLEKLPLEEKDRSPSTTITLSSSESISPCSSCD